MQDDWGDELPVQTLQQVNKRFDSGSARMAGIEQDHAATTQELRKTRQELHELKQQLADLLEFFEAMRGAFKVLNWLGKLAKPTAAIVGLGASVMAAYAAWRGVR